MYFHLSLKVKHKKFNCLNFWGLLLALLGLCFREVTTYKTLRAWKDKTGLGKISLRNLTAYQMLGL